MRVEREFSSWAQVKSGIPQGSVLGPTVFIMFINDMPDAINSIRQLFADDAKIFRSVRSNDDNKKLQDVLDSLTEWSTWWQLPFNVDKCKSLHIGRNDRKHIYEMDENKLDQVKEEKDLGVLIDNELTFHNQIAAAIKRADRFLGIIKKSFTLLDVSTLPLLYKSLVRPHLGYANVVWGPYYKEDIQAIEREQRIATKMVTQHKVMPYEDRLRALNLPSLAHRRRRGDIICTYKLMTGKTNISKDDFFTSTNLTTKGHQFKIFKRHASKLPRINTFSNRIVNDCTQLPSKIVQATSINSFKSRLDKHWCNVLYVTPF